jgi:hypothetical protein
MDKNDKKWIKKNIKKSVVLVEDLVVLFGGGWFGVVGEVASATLV